ncbi:hypothetical protein HC031_01045 [Planosporangium thailandense]|uniref:Uncharacterized protein n=1 Tax=Planosporangium thailandense TaxID=765197 RepID=A0ABX0XQQ5_9ACTN|nr:hypothetical protein [Planosporangium thailandense]NJC68312.1 hypothetical protein [Planosporangium thailandense]
MRRLGLLVIGVGTAAFGLATPALADPSPAPAGPGQPADVACTLSDPQLIGLTGLLARPGGGYVLANTSPQQANPMRVYYLDSKCKVDKAVSYPAAARDPEDLAVASDGTVWVADIGDNPSNGGERRQTIALWKVPSNGGNPVIYRLAYPDGQHDAKALLFGPGDTPIIVTKESSGTAQIYEPTGPLQPNTRQGVPLKNVGSWKPTRTGTANFLGATGQILVTGAAQSPDRKRVALRTYSDAYEWNVPDGDVVKAITTGKPRITPLAGENQGEAIAYSADGASYLTCSSQTGPSQILRYRPAAAVAGKAVPTTGKAAKKADSRPWFQKLSLPQLIDVVAGVGVLGLVLVVVGVLGIRRSRKTRRAAVAAGRTDSQATGAWQGDPGSGPDTGSAAADRRQAGRGGAPAGAGQPARAGVAVPGGAGRPGRAEVAAPAPPDAKRQGRASVAPPDPQRSGPAQPARSGPAQPARSGQPVGGGQPPARGGQPPRGGQPSRDGGGKIYGGGYAGSGPDQRGGRQGFAPPGYRPDRDGDARYFPERF